jgi:hypothetical protein
LWRGEDLLSDLYITVQKEAVLAAVDTAVRGAAQHLLDTGARFTGRLTLRRAAKLKEAQTQLLALGADIGRAITTSVSLPDMLCCAERHSGWSSPSGDYRRHSGSHGGRAGTLYKRWYGRLSF